MCWLCGFGVFGLMLCSYSLPAFHCRLIFNPKLHACANYAHTYERHSRTCSFSIKTKKIKKACSYQIKTLPIPLICHWRKHMSNICQTYVTDDRCKPFSACFIFIKWSTINYNGGATVAKKIASMDLTRGHRCSRAAAAIGQCTLWSYDVWVCVSCTFQECTSTPQAHIFRTVTIKWSCYYECYHLLYNEIVYCLL